MRLFNAIAVLAFVLPSIAVLAADYPPPNQGEWTAHDFVFHTGEVMPEVKLHYTTIGQPTGTPAIVLHGTGGSAESVLPLRPATRCVEVLRHHPRRSGARA